MFKIKYSFILMILFFAIGLGGIMIIKNKAIDLKQFHGTLLDKPRTLPLFSLTSTKDTPFNNASLKGHWTILFFGFTRCGSLCPTTMGELGKMYHILENQQIEPKPEVVMITIDPERDTLEKLKQYVNVFHPHFLGARGSQTDLYELTKALGIAYMKVVRQIPSNTIYDDIEHTGALMFLNPKGELVAFTTPPHQAAALADDYHLLIQSY